MKSLLITLIGTITIGTVLPAFAGPDFQVLQQSRKAHAARIANAQQSSGNSTASTPQSGSQETQHDKMMKQCMEMMQKS